MKKFISIFLSLIMLFSVLTATIITAHGTEIPSQPTPNTEKSTQPTEPIQTTQSTEPTQPIYPPRPSTATSGKCGKTSTWNYDSDTKTLTISGTGKISNFCYDSIPWYSVAKSIEKLNIADGITEIGYYNFYKCKSLTNVTIPDSVTSMGSYAFIDCSNLTSITIGKNVTNIGPLAFSGCTNLKNVYISDLENWCNIPFEYYSSNPLTYGGNLYLNNKLVTDLIIPDSITNIKNYAFCGCKSIKSIKIPNSVTSIGNDAFLNCTEVTNIIIPKTILSIGEYALGYNYSNDNFNYIKREDFIINGYKNTVAQKYSTEFGVKFKDINNCTHTKVKIVDAKKATYFSKGSTGKIVCKYCNNTIKKSKTIARLKLKTPKAKFTSSKEKLKIEYTKQKNATGFQVKYKISKKSVTKTFNTKKTATKTIKNLKKGTYKVQIRAFVKSGSKKAYSSWTKAKTVKVK